MLSFLAMIFTLRLGLGATPVDRAVVSLRDEVAAVAAITVEREAAGEVAPVRAADASLGWGAPARHVLTKDDWKNMLLDTLSNETIANAAMWLASQPIGVRVSGQRFFVTVRVSTP